MWLISVRLRARDGASIRQSRQLETTSEEQLGVPRRMSSIMQCPDKFVVEWKYRRATGLLLPPPPLMLLLLRSAIDFVTGHSPPTRR